MARSGFEVQKVTVEALFLREIRTRFGKFRLGYLWAILEPSAHLLILLGIFGYIMHRTMPDISFPVFLLNGLIPFFIFSSISKRSFFTTCGYLESADHSFMQRRLNIHGRW